MTMSSEDGFETLDNEYEELMLQDSWETHLAPCPEGLFLIRSDFCTDSDEILPRHHRPQQRRQHSRCHPGTARRGPGWPISSSRKTASWNA